MDNEARIKAYENQGLTRSDAQAAVEAEDNGAPHGFKNSYSVLLLTPDYLADQYGEDTFYTIVEANTPEKAVELARLEAADGHEMEDGTGHHLSNEEVGADFRLLLLIAGAHPDLASSFCGRG